MSKYQTDYTGHIYKHGCLLCSIVTACEELVRCELSEPHFLNLVEYLHWNARTSYDPDCPVLSDENDKHLLGSFVWDHEAVFNETFKRFGAFHRVKYTGRIYMPWEEARGKKSFGEHGGDIIILQIKTPNTGHFRLPSFDPWKPGTKMVDLKSLRYYTLV